MSTLVVLPVLVALATAVATLLVRKVRPQRVVSLLGALGYTGATLAVFERVVVSGGADTVLAYYVGDWPAPFGITLVADALSASMLALAGLVALPAVAFAVVYVRPDGQRLAFHPLTHFMLAGVTGSFLTGDLFNLFVWFEVMLMASYILVVFYSGPQETRAGFAYVVLNLVGSAVMLVAIGGIYATVGTLNMADISRRLANPVAFDVAVGPTLGLAALLLAVFALKAGLVPFHFWVPGAYRAAPAPVTALLAAVVKKVAVYAIIRLFYTVFAAAEYTGGSAFGYVGPVLLVMAGASVLYGGIAAVGSRNVEETLSFSSIAQIGFIVLPLGVAMTVGAVPGDLPGGTLATLAIAAALVYSFTHGLAKAALFLIAGTLTSAVGTTRFRELGGLARRTPIAATAFLLAGLALIGIPPVIGFFGKLLVFRVGVVAGSLSAGAGGGVVSRGPVGGAGAVAVGWASVAVALVGAILTIAYVTRAWNETFWGEAPEVVAVLLARRWERGGAGDTQSGAPAAPDGGDASVTEQAERSDGQRETDEPAPDRIRSGDAGPQAATARVLAVEVTAAVVLAVALVGFGIGAEFVVDAAVTAAEAATDAAGYREAVLPDTVTTEVIER